MLSTVVTTILVINELMAANVGEVMSPAINFDSWIELYNPGDSPISLGGMSLSDHRGHQWTIPASVGSVEAKGYKIIWLGSNDIREDQCTFKLDGDGGTITLTDAQGNEVVSQSYPEAISHTAYARTTDGGDAWGWTAQPTPGATNSTSVFATKRLNPPVVDTSSKLFTGSFDVHVDIPEGATLMYTTDGSLPSAPKDQGEVVSPWIDYVINGDCEGDDASSLISRDADGNTDEERIVNGVGVDNSRGIKIHAIKNPQYAWSAQFFVYTPDHVWQAGEKYRFKMMVRADKSSYITVQAHGVPHDYITGNMLDGRYNVNTEWQEITYEGVITEQQSGGASGGWWGNPTPATLQTIVFNLNEEKKENYFYFDNVSWELDTSDGDVSDPSQQSTDGKFTINRTTALTLRLFQDGYLPSVPVTRSYIQTNNQYTLPVISIVGDRRYFTDPKIGFDCDGDGTNGKIGNGQDRPKNYNQEWDRPVNFSYLSPEGEMLFNQDVNISASGGWTRSQRFRSFKLKSNKVFDGQNRFDYSFFPQKPYIRSKTLLVRNGGNDVWTHGARFMDPALETIIQRSGIDVDVQSYVPIIEYVNGELRGVLNLREPNNDKFAYANWGYDDEEIDAFENLKMKNGTDEVINRIFELGNHINDEGVYEELKQLLDIDEFTNYMAVTMFLDNDDWPNNNIKAYRSQHDGRYRFISFDLDYAFALRGFNRDNDDPFKYFLRFKDDDSVYGEGNQNREIVRLFLNLLGHDEYRRKFIDTFCLVAGSVFEPTVAGEIVDELLAVVQPMCQMMQQQGLYDGHTPERAATDIKSKLDGRAKKMAGHMKDFSYLKLSKTNAQNVTLKSDTEGANIYVNDQKVPYSSFDGYLFAPVKLRAEAPVGYNFVGWLKGNTLMSEDAEIDLPSNAIIGITAAFRPLTDAERQNEGILPVRINEVSAANDIYVNEYFKRNDWVELYNTTNDPIDVEGMYISDNVQKPKKYQITKDGSQASTIIPPHGFLIVWCDKLEPVSQLHASFKLSAGGGDVLLTAADESWTDHFTYDQLAADQTAGRYPDGSPLVYTMNIPTIAKGNMASSYLINIEQPELGISDVALAANTLNARYVVGRLVVRGAADDQLTVSIVNLSGQSIAKEALRSSGDYAEMSLGQLSDGVYIATVTDAKGHKATIKFVK